MPPEAVLVNIADAHIVEPMGLKDALLAGSLRTAAFDGYWQEPLPTLEEDPYGPRELDDGFILFVTPHVAGRTSEAWERMIDNAIEQLRALEAGTD